MPKLIALANGLALALVFGVCMGVILNHFTNIYVSSFVLTLFSFFFGYARTKIFMSFEKAGKGSSLKE